MKQPEVEEDDPSLASKCLDICQALAAQGRNFTFNLTLSPFSFSLDTRGEEKVTSPEKVKKRPSPSTQRRNLRRKIEFQTKKVEENKESETNNDLDATSQKSNTFKCEQCENIFESEKGLKIHIGRQHKAPKPLPSPEKVREVSLETSLSVSPEKVTERVEEGGETETDEEKDENNTEQPIQQRSEAWKLPRPPRRPPRPPGLRR